MLALLYCFQFADISNIYVQAAQAAGKWFIEKFLVHGLIAAISLPMTVLGVSKLIDSQWSVVSNPFLVLYIHTQK